MNDINKKRREALEELKPKLENFMNKYGCPHDTLIVRQTGAEFVSGECAVPFRLWSDKEIAEGRPKEHIEDQTINSCNGICEECNNKDCPDNQ